MQNKPKVLLIYPGNKSSAGAYSQGLLYVAKSLHKILRKRFGPKGWDWASEKQTEKEKS